MISIEKLCLGELQTNCYLLRDPNAKEAIIVDPAAEAEFIGEKLARENTTPKLIIATHGHFDHILAAWELQLAFDIPFLIHKDDLFLVKKLTSSASYWLKRKVWQKPPEKIEFVEKKEKIELGKHALEVIHTPGHTPGSICLYSEEEEFILTGDTLFARGVGRTDFSYSSKKLLFLSLRKIFSLPSYLVIHPGHGPSCSLKEALANFDESIHDNR